MAKKNLISIFVIVILVVALGVITYMFLQVKQDNSDMQELFAIEKEELENEYSNFANQYDELQMNITNDSLQAQLEKEKLKTQRLLEELRQTKSTDAAEITRLKKELETVRSVLKNYIIQIDSLNAINQKLVNENKQVKKRYSDAERQISNLSEEKKSLSEKVTLASQLDATNITLLPTKKNGKEAKKIKDALKLVINFTLAKNVTASTGEKIVYINIAKPDEETLTKDSNNTFDYEDTSLTYSIKKYIEYSGEEQTVTVYWDVEEFLYAGTYTVYIFADGVMIGSNNFELK